MDFPTGLPTKKLTFGRYVSVLGLPRSGKVSIGFDKPMLHQPSGAVLVAGNDNDMVDRSGELTIEVPVTTNGDLIADWLTDHPTTGQRLRVQIDVTGYKPEAFYIDVHEDDADTLDFDEFDRYPDPVASLPILRATVRNVAGLTGTITAEELAARLEEYLGGVDNGPVTPIRYTHTQASPAAIWIVEHNLGHYPASITAVVDGEEVEPDVFYPDTQRAYLTYGRPVAGRAEVI